MIMASVQRTNPSLPFWDAIPGGLSVGKVIEIQGVFPAFFDLSKYSQINLCENSRDTIPLHLSIRFNHRKVIRNTSQRNNWQNEEKDGPFPFEEGRQFLVQIVVQPNNYQIFVNGQLSWTFNHRLPFSKVTQLNIDGPLTVWKVEYKSNAPLQPQTTSYPAQPAPKATPKLESIYNPNVPFSYNITGGIKNGMMIYISGIPNVNFHKFTVNLQCGQQQSADVAFHIDVRKHNSTIVRNTRRNNRWENEETTVPYFPFQSSVPFDMVILILNDKYMVAVNGAHFIEYHHRMTRFRKINILRIENDVRISSVRFSE